METIVRVTVATSFEGNRVYSLDRNFDADGQPHYFVTIDESNYTGYRAGPPIQKTPINSTLAEAFLIDLKETTIGLCPSEAMGLDGVTTTVEVTRGFNKATFTWWCDLPKQWEPLRSIIGLFEK